MNSQEITISQATGESIYHIGLIVIMISAIFILFTFLFKFMSLPRYGEKRKYSPIFISLFGIMLYMSFAPKVLRMIINVLIDGEIPKQNTESDIPWNTISWVVIALSVAGIIIYSMMKLIPEINQSRKDKIKDNKQKKKIHEEISSRKMSINDRFNTIKGLYAEAEISPETLLYAPLILDVYYPLTAEFHRNLKNSQRNIDTITHRNDKNSMLDIIEAERSLDVLEDSWKDLKENAYKIGIPVIDAKTSERAKKILSQVLDETITPEERKVYADKLIAMLKDNQKKLSRAQQEEMGRIIDIISEKILGAVEQGQLTNSNTTMLMLER